MRNEIECGSGNAECGIEECGIEKGGRWNAECGTSQTRFQVPANKNLGIEELRN
jgi:hypothetical protein